MDGGACVPWHGTPRPRTERFFSTVGCRRRWRPLLLACAAPSSRIVCVAPAEVADGGARRRYVVIFVLHVDHTELVVQAGPALQQRRRVLLSQGGTTVALVCTTPEEVFLHPRLREQTLGASEAMWTPSPQRVTRSSARVEFPAPRAASPETIFRLEGRACHFRHRWRDVRPGCLFAWHIGKQKGSFMISGVV